MNFHVKLVELVPLIHKFVPQSHVGIFSQRMHPMHPIRPQTHVLVHFRPFRYRTNFGVE
jgi:hypothetical protein